METRDRVQAEPVHPELELGGDSTPFTVDANVIATGRTCVIGASGSGKSYAVGVICEELCKDQVPFAIIDTEGEYSGLKERYDAIWIGDEPRCDLQWSTLDLEQMGAQAPDVAPLILDLSETDEPRQKVSSLLSSIYREVERRRTPYLVILEEADRFIPQNGEKITIFGEIARRGRKRGMGLMVCTQRPSLVDKNTLSQCGNQLIGKLVINNDLQSVSQFFQGHQLPRQLTTLPSGSFFAMGGLSAVPRLIKIREKLTKHGGSTPRLAGRVVKPFKPAGSKSVAGAVAVPKVGGEAAVGINPAFREEDIPNIIRRDKSFIFFGEEESVTRAQLVMRPMVEVGVAVRAGVLKKRVEIKYLVLDGETGRFVELREVPVLSDGIQWLIGLTSEHIEVLRTIRPDRSMSSLEIANKLGVSREMLRRPIRELESRRLIASFRAGRSSVYRRSYSFPDIQWHDTERALEPVAIQAKSARGLIAEDSVREVLKGLIPHSDVQTFRAFFYPLYRVELMMKRRKRVVWLDGQTGEEFRP